MTILEGAKGRRANQPPSGYTRLFGNSELGNLMSRVQSAVISSGTELEKLIWERVSRILDLDLFVSGSLISTSDEVWVADKKHIRESRCIRGQGEPDFLAFELAKRVCYVIEVKDGDQFDTKKSSSEYAMLHDFADKVRYALPLDFQIRICCFNAQDRSEVYNGLKRKFSLSEILTGRELCALFRIDYDDIVSVREADQARNMSYFIRCLVAIPEVREMVIKEQKA